MFIHIVSTYIFLHLQHDCSGKKTDDEFQKIISTVGLLRLYISIIENTIGSLLNFLVNLNMREASTVKPMLFLYVYRERESGFLFIRIK
jgi:hypothetical protein